MKSISNAAAFSAMSLMIGCKPNASSMVGPQEGEWTDIEG
jgi:hypothetical protein